MGPPHSEVEAAPNVWSCSWLMQSLKVMDSCLQGNRANTARRCASSLLLLAALANRAPIPLNRAPIVGYGVYVRLCHKMKYQKKYQMENL